MFFRKGPLGLIVISIVVLIINVAIYYECDVDDEFIYFVIFGSPVISWIIYYIGKKIVESNNCDK